MDELERARELARGALASLEANRRRIDDLNVFPVPDGDTGTNMAETLRAVVDELEKSDVADRPALTHEIAHAALLGARGNSGVILSQIIRGAMDALAGEATIETRVLARTFRSASDAAYRAVREPVEGTMLSAIRALADEAEREPADFWRAVTRAGDEAVARTESQLDVLREAGVVDAGAAGLLEIVRGVAAVATGEEIELPITDHRAAGIEAAHQELSRYRYCTTFVVEGDGIDSTHLEHQLEELGDSLLVVGDATAVKIHVHTDDPGAALSLATAVGVIERVEIANMHEQAAAREQRILAETTTSVVAVVSGGGNRRLFESLGAQVVEGGQAMNPSVRDLVSAIEGARAKDVIVLPNNANVLSTAEQAGSAAKAATHVVATRSMQEGLSAVVAFDPSASARENVDALTAAVQEVVTGEVTIAVRDAQVNGIAVRKGDYLGLAHGEAVARGDDFDAVAEAVVERLLAEPRSILTLLTGDDAEPINALVRRIKREHPEIEVEVQEGGQPHYPLLLAAE